MALTKQEKKLIDVQIKAYQNMIKHFRGVIRSLREQRKGGHLRNAKVVVGGPGGRSTIIKKD